MNSAEGQQWRSMLVDLAFFGVLAAFGLRHILSEGVLATLLSAYAAHRFGVAMGKQQAVIALSGGPPSGTPSQVTTTTTTTEGAGPSTPPVSRAHRQQMASLIGVKV